MSSEINFKIVFLVLLHLLIHVLIKCDRILIVEGFANFVERSTAGKRGAPCFGGRTILILVKFESSVLCKFEA